MRPKDLTRVTCVLAGLLVVTRGSGSTCTSPNIRLVRAWVGNMIILVTMVTMNLVVGDEAGDGCVRVAGPRPSAHQLVQTLGAGQVLQ